MSILLQKTVSITIKDIFGTIEEVNVIDVQGDRAKISFKRFQSTYLMWAQLSWLFTKDGTTAQDIKKGGTCSANIPLTTTAAIRNATVLEVGPGHLVVQAGNRLRVVPFARITNCYHNLAAATGKAVAVVGTKAARPAKALENPAASAPVAQRRAAPVKAPVPVRGR